MKKLLSGGGIFVAATTFAYWSPAPVYAPVQPLQEVPVKVLFVGDLMLDRNVARSLQEEGAWALFATSTRSLFAAADLRVANLEGAVTANPSIARRNNKILRFTFEPAITETVLTLLNLNIISLANNHALDFGADGYTETRSRVEALGVGVFGHPYNATGTISNTVTVQGKRFCFVGYHSLFAPSTATITEEIKIIRPDCWRVVVFAHWGEEYKTTAAVAQRDQGHTFIDAGADLVIGAHPHVVEEVEVYKGKAIFYSLGNFMFDQNFSWETTHGLADGPTFTPIRQPLF